MIKRLFLIIFTLFTVNLNLYSKEIIKNNFLDKEIYLGNKIGLSNFTNLKNLNNNFKIVKTRLEPNQFGFGSFLGYKINNNLNFEIGYENLGKAIKKSKFIKGYFKSKGITILSKINLNLNKNINLYTRFGWIIIKSISKKNNIINNIKNITFYKKITPLTSIGIEYKINNNLTTRIDYQKIYNLGQRNFLNEEPSNNLFNLNLIYKINNEKKILNIKKKNSNFNLIYFNNISSNISKLYLDNILNLIKLKKFNIKNIYIIDFIPLIKSNNKNKINNFINYIKTKNIPIYKIYKKTSNIKNFLKIKCNKFRNNNLIYLRCFNHFNKKIFIKIKINK